MNFPFLQIILVTNRYHDKELKKLIFLKPFWRTPFQVVLKKVIFIVENNKYFNPFAGYFLVVCDNVFVFLFQAEFEQMKKKQTTEMFKKDESMRTTTNDVEDDICYDDDSDEKVMTEKETTKTVQQNMTTKTVSTKKWPQK